METLLPKSKQLKFGIGDRMNQKTFKEAKRIDTTLKSLRKELAAAKRVCNFGETIELTSMDLKIGTYSIPISTGRESIKFLLDGFIKETNSKINRLEKLWENL